MRLEVGPQKRPRFLLKGGRPDWIEGPPRASMSHRPWREGRVLRRAPCAPRHELSIYVGVQPHTPALSGEARRKVGDEMPGLGRVPRSGGGLTCERGCAFMHFGRMHSLWSELLHACRHPRPNNIGSPPGVSSDRVLGLRTLKSPPDVAPRSFREQNRLRSP